MTTTTLERAPIAVPLSDEDDIAGYVELVDARDIDGHPIPPRPIPVKPIDGTGRVLYERLLRQTGEDADVWRLARRLVPTATEAEIGALTAAHVSRIAMIACGQMEAVLAHAKARGFSTATPEQMPASPESPANGSDPSTPD